MTESVLDDVAGLGPIRKRRLMEEFGTLKKLENASLAQLREIPWLPNAVADDLHEELHGPRAPETAVRLG
jgi:excinuclease ABC subunit C